MLLLPATNASMPCTSGGQPCFAQCSPPVLFASRPGCFGRVTAIVNTLSVNLFEQANPSSAALFAKILHINAGRFVQFYTMQLYIRGNMGLQLLPDGNSQVFSAAHFSFHKRHVQVQVFGSSCSTTCSLIILLSCFTSNTNPVPGSGFPFTVTYNS